MNYFYSKEKISWKWFRETWLNTRQLILTSRDTHMNFWWAYAVVWVIQIWILYFRIKQDHYLVKDKSFVYIQQFSYLSFWRDYVIKYVRKNMCLTKLSLRKYYVNGSKHLKCYIFIFLIKKLLNIKGKLCVISSLMIFT